MNVFVSYRRSDSRNAAARLGDLLLRSPEIDHVFFDVESIQVGENFEQRIAESLSTSDVCLVLIGPGWLARDENNLSRLESADDFVRMEILAALKANIKVIPVLLDGATMPTPFELPEDLIPLASLNAAHIRHETFKQDARGLQNAFLGNGNKLQPSPNSVFMRVFRSAAGLAVSALLLLIIGVAHKAIIGGSLDESLGTSLTKVLIVVTLILGIILPLIRKK